MVGRISIISNIFTCFYCKQFRITHSIIKTPLLPWKPRNGIMPNLSLQHSSLTGRSFQCMLCAVCSFKRLLHHQTCNISDFHTAAGDLEKVGDVELQWQDASSVDYTHFYRDEPRLSKYDDQCVTLDTEHGMWITEECSLSRGFVCRVNKGTVWFGITIT